MTEHRPEPAPGTDPERAYAQVLARCKRAEAKNRVLKAQVDTLTTQRNDYRRLVQAAITRETPR